MTLGGAGFSNPGIGVYVPIAPTDYALVAGAAGFVDTDISASIPLGARLVEAFTYPENTVELVGIRDVGYAIDTRVNMDAWRFYFCRSRQTAGHIEIARNATNTIHCLITGYWL